ncbi:MAG: ABC transporter substrate-binding protein [Eubacteriales bacterium]|nr:ABC transporter substrate-binding protein [Eubacteriales bacterium]
MTKVKSFLALVLALTLVVACVPSVAGASSAASTVRIGQSSEVANLNPMLQPRTPDSNVQNLIFSYLVVPDENLNFVGDLATSWDISDDGLTYTFHLRNDATWHDGEPFTAADVVFTFTSLAAPGYTGGAENRVLGLKGAPAYQAGEADSIEGLSAPDDYTVVFELSEVNAAFLSNMYTAILPKHVLENEDPSEWANDDFNRAPIGTGKYKFVEWKSGQYISLTRNDSYFGAHPSIENVIVQFGADTTLVAALINGEIDVLYGLPASEMETVEAMPNIGYYSSPALSVYYIGLNQLVESLSDLRIRQALAYALDKETLVDTLFGSEVAYVADDIFPANHWSHADDVQTYAFDPEKAKALIEEAGYTMGGSGIYEKDGKPLHLTFDVAESSTVSAMSALIQQMWKAVGIDCEIISQDFSTLAYTKLFPSDSDGNPRYVTADDFMMYTLGFGVEVDPNEYNEYLSTAKGPGSWNFISYSNPTVDELFAKQLVQTNPEERAATFHEIAKIISQDIPWIPLYGKNNVEGVSNRVQNYVADFRGITFQIEKWSLAE